MKGGRGAAPLPPFRLRRNRRSLLFPFFMTFLGRVPPLGPMLWWPSGLRPLAKTLPPVQTFTHYDGTQKHHTAQNTREDHQTEGFGLPCHVIPGHLPLLVRRSPDEVDAVLDGGRTTIPEDKLLDLHLTSRHLFLTGNSQENHGVLIPPDLHLMNTGHQRPLFENGPFPPADPFTLVHLLKPGVVDEVLLDLKHFLIHLLLGDLWQWADGATDYEGDQDQRKHRYRLNDSLPFHLSHPSRDRSHLL